MFLLALVAVFLAFVSSAQAQLAPCEPQMATAGGTAWTCPLGGIRGINDIEAGTEHYENGVLDKPKLDLNISSGEAAGVRSRIALNPDTGGPGTVIFDGRKNKIASFYPAEIQFFSPLYLNGLDVGQQLLQQQVKAASLEKRLVRTHRRFLRLHRQVVALRKLVENGGRRKLR